MRRYRFGAILNGWVRGIGLGGLLVLGGSGGLGAAGLEVTPSSHAFGPGAAGTPSAPVTVTVSNPTATAIPLGTARLRDPAGGPAEAFTRVTDTDTCSGATLDADATCTLTVQYTPAAGQPLAQANLILPYTGAEGAAERTVFLYTGATDRSQAEQRLPPILRALRLPEALRVGQPATFEWTLSGYDPTYRVRLVLFECAEDATNCGASYADHAWDSGLLDPVAVRPGDWSYRSARSYALDYTYTFTPSAEAFAAEGGELVVRFFHKSQADAAAERNSLSLLAPGGVLDEAFDYADTAGRRLATPLIGAAPRTTDPAARLVGTAEPLTLELEALGAPADPTNGLQLTAVNATPTALPETRTLASGATLTLGAHGQLSYTPEAATLTALGAGQTRTETLTYTLTETGVGVSTTGTLTITLEGVNDPPQATGGGVTTDEDSPRVIPPGVLGTDPDTGDVLVPIRLAGQALGAAGDNATLASGARVTRRADGGLDYHPHGAFEALGDGEQRIERLDYTLADSAGATDNATLEVTVTGVNDAPVGGTIRRTLAFPGAGLAYQAQAIDGIDSVSALDPAAPIDGYTETPSPAVRPRAQDFGLRFSGYLDIDRAGDYTFYLTSKDGSRLRIDGATVVDNDGVQGRTEASGTVRLERGLHPLALSYFHTEGSPELTLELAGPGLARRTIQAHRFLRARPTHTFDALAAVTDAEGGGAGNLTVTAVDGDPAQVGQPLTLPGGVELTVTAAGNATFAGNGAFWPAYDAASAGFGAFEPGLGYRVHAPGTDTAPELEVTQAQALAAGTPAIYTVRHRAGPRDGNHRWRLQVGLERTEALALSASPARLEAALEALPNLAGRFDVAVTGDFANGGYEVRFTRLGAGLLRVQKVSSYAQEDPTDPQSEVTAFPEWQVKIPEGVIAPQDPSRAYTLAFDDTPLAPLAYAASRGTIKAAVEAHPGIEQADIKGAPLPDRELNGVVDARGETFYSEGYTIRLKDPLPPTVSALQLIDNLPRERLGVFDNATLTPVIARVEDAFALAVTRERAGDPEAGRGPRWRVEPAAGVVPPADPAERRYRLAFQDPLPARAPPPRALAYNAASATIEAALEARPGVDDVAVTGSLPGGGYEVEWLAPIPSGDADLRVAAGLGGSALRYDAHGRVDPGGSFSRYRADGQEGPDTLPVSLEVTDRGGRTTTAQVAARAAPAYYEAGVALTARCSTQARSAFELASRYLPVHRAVGDNSTRRSVQIPRGEPLAFTQPHGATVSTSVADRLTQRVSAEVGRLCPAFQERIALTGICPNGASARYQVANETTEALDVTTDTGGSARIGAGRVETVDVPLASAIDFFVRGAPHSTQPAPDAPACAELAGGLAVDAACSTPTGTAIQLVNDLPHEVPVKLAIGEFNGTAQLGDIDRLLAANSETTVTTEVITNERFGNIDLFFVAEDAALGGLEFVDTTSSNAIESCFADDLTLTSVCSNYETSRFTLTNRNPVAVDYQLSTRSSLDSGTIEANQTQTITQPYDERVRLLLNGLSVSSVPANIGILCEDFRDKLPIRGVCKPDADTSRFEVANANGEFVELTIAPEPKKIPVKANETKTFDVTFEPRISVFIREANYGLVESNTGSCPTTFDLAVADGCVLSGSVSNARAFVPVENNDSEAVRVKVQSLENQSVQTDFQRIGANDEGVFELFLESVSPGTEARLIIELEDGDTVEGPTFNLPTRSCGV